MMTNAHDTTLAEQLLDPGIADVVIMLRNLGFNPTDSGDGVSKPDAQRDFDVKHVACSWPTDKDKCSPADFLSEARRLQSVLGSGWSVEASFATTDSSFILLATKNEKQGPRHAEATTNWQNAVADMGVARQSDRVYRAGAGLYVALEHELGRR